MNFNKFCEKWQQYQKIKIQDTWLSWVFPIKEKEEEEILHVIISWLLLYICLVMVSNLFCADPYLLHMKQFEIRRDLWG